MADLIRFAHSDSDEGQNGALWRPRLILLKAAQLYRCQFWVSYYKKGKAPANSICKNRGLEDCFQMAVTTGFKENQPVMMAGCWDAVAPGTCCLFFPSFGRFANAANQSTSDVTDILEGWKPQDIGFYIPPELFKSPGCNEILKALIEASLERKIAKNIYCYTGSHGLNDLLAVVIELKKSNPRSIDILH